MMESVCRGNWERVACGGVIAISMYHSPKTRASDENTMMCFQQSSAWLGSSEPVARQKKHRKTARR